MMIIDEWAKTSEFRKFSFQYLGLCVHVMSIFIINFDFVDLPVECESI